MQFFNLPKAEMARTLAADQDNFEVELQQLDEVGGYDVMVGGRKSSCHLNQKVENMVGQA